jgi:hypothetical protein
VLPPNLNHFTIVNERGSINLTTDTPLDWVFSDGVEQWTPANSHFYVAVVDTDSNGNITGWDFDLYSNPGFSDPEVYTISTTPPSSYAPYGTYGSDEVILSLTIPGDYAYVMYGAPMCSCGGADKKWTPSGILFSDLGPGGSYSGGFQPVYGSAATSQGASRTLADLFTVAGSGTEAVTEIDLGVAITGNSAVVQPFAVSIWTDNSGVPGTQIPNAYWRLSTGSPPCNVGLTSCPLVSISGISGVTLTGGTQYFLLLEPVNLNDSSYVGWFGNTQSVVGEEAVSADGGASWFSPYTSYLDAFAVLGVSPLTPFTTSQLSTAASGLLYSRVTKTYNGTVTITNVSGGTLGGPFQIVFTSLLPGVTLANAVGITPGGPYINSGVGSLAPGQSVTVGVQFSNPSNAAINFTTVVY